MVYKILILILISGFMFSCNLNNDMSAREDKKIISDLMDKIAIKYQLTPVAISEASDNKQYTEIGFCFYKYKIMTKDEGRGLVIEIVQFMLDELNNNEKMQPYLSQKPFSDMNVRVSIYNTDEKYTRLEYPEVATFRFFRGIMTFCYRTPEEKYVYTKYEEETFEEALSIVKMQQQHER